MAGETPSEGGLIHAVQARRRNLMPRVTAAALLALMASQMIGWETVAPWLGAYGAVQLLELWAWPPKDLDRMGEGVAPWRAAFGCLTIALNATAFGAVSVPLWSLGGPVGAICAAFVLAAAVINAVVTSPGSRTVLCAALGPQFAYLAALVSATHRFGGHAGLESATALGALLFCTYALLLWRTLETARESETHARREAEQRQAALEAAIASRSRFTAVIGHELRTPISAMLAGVSELKTAAADPDQLSRLLLVEDAGRMMKSLLDDLLDQAKLEAQRLTLEETPVALRDLLAQTLRMWRSQAEAKGLRLRLEGADQAPHSVLADPTRLRQILNNLISNALKFTPSGSVTLAVSAWPAGDEGCALQLRIIDTGEGMTPEQAARLFTPFEQLETTSARNFGGSGLGLAISRQLARLMGGDLTASSARGDGSTFTLALTLPLLEFDTHDGEAPDALSELEDALARGAPDPAPADPAPQPRSEPEPLPAAEPEAAEAQSEAQAEAAADEDQPLRVLVADDHEINRRAVELVLAPLGAQITGVANGRQALDAALLQPFDVIVMDVRMPEMNGREATRNIRAAAGPNQATPVIAVTADSDAGDVQACRDAGMNWFVAKPIDPGKLVQTVVDALDEAEQAREAERAVA